MTDRTNLRIPGPTPLPAPVREAGARQMINHRGPEFRELIARVTERLRTPFGTAEPIYVLTASGTGGLEAALVNHLSPADPVLGVSIGSFGDRFAEIAERFGAHVRRLEVEWGNAAEPEAIADALRAMAAEGQPARAVLLTHNETSTGVVNPLRELSAAIHETAPDALVIVDAISGLGAVPFEMDGWRLDVVVTGSQKSWMVAPGLAMIAVSERARAAWATAAMARHYFDLGEARRYADKGETPWTPAVGVLFQLDVALDLLDAEGYPQIFARHAACATAARAGLEALGLRLLADPAHASDTVTSAWLPDGVEWSQFNRQLLDRGLVIAGGQGKLAGRILRVGHLGAVFVADVIEAVEVIEQACLALGLDVEPGAGGRAAAGAAQQRTPVAVEA